MQSVSYWEAWSLWFSGQKLDGLMMGGTPLIWWARAGKVAQYAGGLIAVIDLVGAARFERMSDRIAMRAPARKRASSWIPLVWFLFGLLPVYLIFRLVFTDSDASPFALVAGFIVVVGGSISVALRILPIYAGRLVKLAIFLLRIKEASHPLRWLALLAIAIGFHLDLLAS